MELKSGCNSGYKRYEVRTTRVSRVGQTLDMRAERRWGDHLLDDGRPRRYRSGFCKGSSRGHVGFVDIEVGVDFLHVVVIFDGFHQAQHLLRVAAFELDVVLRDH